MKMGTTRNEWKKFRKKFGKLKKKRQQSTLNDGKPMKRKALKPLTRKQDKENN